MNPLFTWIATRASMLTIYYPDFSGKLDPNAQGKAFGAGGVAFSEAYNDGTPVDHQAIDFYTAFRNYLRVSRPMFNWIRIGASEFARFLYYLANALLSFFVKMFKLFDVAGTPFGDNNYSTIARVFHDGIWFGVAIMVLVATFYVTGEIIGGASWSRNKNILRNTVLILFIIFGLPASTSLMTKGAVDVAHDAFGNSITRNSGGSHSIGTEITSLFQNNVYSIPLRVEQMKPGKSFDTGTQGLWHEHTHGYYDVNTTPLIIRLQNMSQSTRNKYNGLGTNDHPSSIATFLEDYGHDQMLDPDNLNDITTSMTTTAEKKQGMLGKAKAGATSFANGIPIIGNFTSKHDQTNAASDFRQIFSYYIANDGISGGGGPTKEEHKLKKFPYHHFDYYIENFYTLYYVNWFAVYSGLLMMILVTATYLYKLFKLFYKLVIMYVSSAPLLARNVDNYSRIKSWTRDLFSIYEMLIMMVVMFYMFFVVYNITNGAIDGAVEDARTGFIANPYVEACVDLLADLSLFRISMMGIRSVDTMVGSQGGGANTGATGVVGGMLALRAGGAVTRTLGNTGIGNGVKGVGNAIGHPFKTAKSFRHGINNHLLNHKKNNKKGDTNARKKPGNNHKPGDNKNPNQKPTSDHGERSGGTHDTNDGGGSTNDNGDPSDDGGSDSSEHSGDSKTNNNDNSSNKSHSNSKNNSRSNSKSNNHSNGKNSKNSKSYNNSHNGGSHETNNNGGSHESTNNTDNNSSNGNKNDKGHGNGSKKTIVGGGSHYDGQNHQDNPESKKNGENKGSHQSTINNRNDYGHNQKNSHHTRNDHRASNHVSFKHNNHQTHNHNNSSHTNNHKSETHNNNRNNHTTNNHNNHTSNHRSGGKK